MPSSSLSSDQPDVAGEAGLTNLLLYVAPATPETTSGAAYERFRADAELISIPVVADGEPVGLIYRTTLMMALAHKYGNALYADKPVTHVMDAQPLIVDHSTSVDVLEATIANEKPSALLRGFIVTRRGRYAGVASALSLLRLSMARTQRRNRELEEARNRAEAANEAKSQFLAIMTHELRTPLNAIIGFTDLMQHGTFGGIEPPRYREYVADIYGAANQLLVIGGTLRVVSERAQMARVRLGSELPDEPVTLRADARALCHILLNLLSNAIKFTPAGGTIEVRLDLRPEGDVELTVADTGIGMAPEHIVVALTPFAQVENAYTRKYEGTGLGLPLVKSLVELHGAEFAIDSRLGAGTAVHIRFGADHVLKPALPASPALARAS